MEPSGLFYIQYPREDCEALLADGIEDAFVVNAGSEVNWSEVDAWMKLRQDWVFGWVGYDVRRSIELFAEENLTPSTFPHLVLFRPKNLFKIQHSKVVEVLKGAWREELNRVIRQDADSYSGSIELAPVVSFETYVSQLQQLKSKIAFGNVYELNYCMPFLAEAALEDPIAAWRKIVSHTEAPFSAYAQFEEHHVLCASPERYLKRTGNRVISQPIKGTIRRGASELEDEQLKRKLFESKKERAENVMIVDLVRNDLSRFAKRDSVKVDELFGTYTFKTVHHLISTISCEVEPEASWIDLIRSTFPMGSMTGAPKVSAM
ncbi:MAG: chorismate-binding protein, partial [Flavobacteriales bacterium]